METQIIFIKWSMNSRVKGHLTSQNMTILSKDKLFLQYMYVWVFDWMIYKLNNCNLYYFMAENYIMKYC